MSRRLTELEGAVLTEIAFRGNDTAYKVGLAFQQSPSTAWSGSLGAIPPAIRRLTARGLIATKPHPVRRGHVLNVTTSGHAALMRWATETGSALGLGFDPFRLRSGIWDTLDQDDRRKVLESLKRGTEQQLIALEERDEDPVDRRQTELAILLLKARLEWITSRSRQP